MSDESHESEDYSFVNTEDDVDESSETDDDPMEDLFGDNALENYFASKNFKESVVKRHKVRSKAGGETSRKKGKILQKLSALDEFQVSNIGRRFSSMFINETQLVQHLFLEICRHLPNHVDQDSLLHEITVAVLYDIFVPSAFETSFLDRSVLGETQPYVLAIKPFAQFVAKFVDSCTDFRAIPTISLTRVVPRDIAAVAEQMNHVFHISSAFFIRILTTLRGTTRHLEELLHIIIEIENTRTLNADLQNMDLFAKLKLDIQDVIEDIGTLAVNSEQIILSASSEYPSDSHLSPGTCADVAIMLAKSLQVEQRMETITSKYEVFLAADMIYLGTDGGNHLLDRSYGERQDIAINDALKRAQKDICAEVEEILNYNVRLLHSIKFVFFAIEKFTKGVSAAVVATEANMYSSAMMDLVGSVVLATDTPTMFSDMYRPSSNGGINKHALIPKDYEVTHKRELVGFAFDLTVYRIQQAAVSFLVTKLHNVCVIHERLCRSTSSDVSIREHIGPMLLDNTSFKDATIRDLLSATLNTLDELEVHGLKTASLYKKAADYMGHLFIPETLEEWVKNSTDILAADHIGRCIRKLAGICASFKLQIQQDAPIDFASMDTLLADSHDMIEYIGLLTYRSISERIRVLNYVVSTFLAPFSFNKCSLPISETASALFHEFLGKTLPNASTSAVAASSSVNDLVYNIVLASAATEHNTYPVPFFIYYFGSISVDTLLAKYIDTMTDELFARTLMEFYQIKDREVTFYTDLSPDEQASMIDDENYVPPGLESCLGYTESPELFRKRLLDKTQIIYAQKAAEMPISKIYTIYKRAIEGEQPEEFPHLYKLVTHRSRYYSQDDEYLGVTPEEMKFKFFENVKVYLQSYLESNPIIEYMTMMFLLKFGAISVELPADVSQRRDAPSQGLVSEFTEDPVAYKSLFSEASYVVNVDDIFSSVCYIHEAPLYLFSKYYAQGFNRVAFIYINEIYESSRRASSHEGVPASNKVTPRIEFSIAKTKHPLVVCPKVLDVCKFGELKEAVSAFIFPYGCFFDHLDRLHDFPSFDSLLELTQRRLEERSGHQISDLHEIVADNFQCWYDNCNTFLDDIVSKILFRAQENLIKVLHSHAIEALETQALHSLSIRFSTPEYNPLRLQKPTMSQTDKERREKPNLVPLYNENKTPFDIDSTRNKSPSFVGACKHFRIMICIPHRIVSVNKSKISRDDKHLGLSVAGVGHDCTTFVVLDRYGRYVSHLILSQYHEQLPNPLRTEKACEQVRNEYRALVRSLDPIFASLVSCPREKLFKVLEPALQVYSSRQSEFQRILDEARLHDYIISSGVCAVGVLSRGFTSDSTYRNLEATLQYLNLPLPKYIEASLLRKEASDASGSNFQVDQWRNVEFPCLEKALISGNPLFIDDLFFKRQPLAYNITRINLLRIPADVPISLYSKKFRMMHDPSFILRGTHREEGARLSFQRQRDIMLNVISSMLKTSTNLIISSSPFHWNLYPVSQAHDRIRLCRQKLSLTTGNVKMYSVATRLALDGLQLDETGARLQKDALPPELFRGQYLPGLYVHPKVDYRAIEDHYHGESVVLGIWAGRYLLDPLAAYACLANGGGSIEDLVAAPLINFMTDFAPLTNLESSDKVRTINVSSDFHARFKLCFSFIAHYALSLAIYRRRPDINLPFISPHYTHLIAFLPWLSARKLLRVYKRVFISRRHDNFLALSSDIEKYASGLEKAQELQAYIDKLTDLHKADLPSDDSTKDSLMKTIQSLEDYFNGDLLKMIRQSYLAILAATSCNIHGERITVESSSKRRGVREMDIELSAGKKANDEHRLGMVFKNKAFLANIIAELILEDFVITYCVSIKEFQDDAFNRFKSIEDDTPFTYQEAVQNIEHVAKGLVGLAKSSCTVADICNIQLINPELALYKKYVDKHESSLPSGLTSSVHLEDIGLVKDPFERPPSADATRYLIANVYFTKLTRIYMKKSLIDFFTNPKYTPTNVMKRVCKYIELVNVALAHGCSITHDVILSYPGGAYSAAYTAENPNIVTTLLLRWIGPRIKDFSFNRYRHAIDRTMLIQNSLELYYTQLYHSVSINAFSNSVQDEEDGYTNESLTERTQPQTLYSDAIFWPENLTNYLSSLELKEFMGLTYHDMVSLSGKETQLVASLFLKFCLFKGSKKLDDFLHNLTLKMGLYQTDYCAARNLALILTSLLFKASCSSLIADPLFNRGTDLRSALDGLRNELHNKAEENHRQFFSSINQLALEEAPNWLGRIQPSIAEGVPLKDLNPQPSRLLFAKELYRYLSIKQSGDKKALQLYLEELDDYKKICALCKGMDRELDKLGDEEPVENLLLAFYKGFKETYVSSIGDDYVEHSSVAGGPASVLQQELVKYLVGRLNRTARSSSGDELGSGKKDFTEGFIFLCSQLMTIDPLLRDLLCSAENIRPVLSQVLDVITQATRYHQLRYPTMELIDAGRPFVEYSKEIIFISLSGESNPAVFSRYRAFKVFCPAAQWITNSVMKRVRVSRYEGLTGQVSLLSDLSTLETEGAIETEFDAYLFGIDLHQNVLSLVVTLSRDEDAAFDRQVKVVDCLPQLHMNKLQLRLLDAILSTEQCYRYSKLSTSITNTYFNRIDKMPKKFASFLEKPVSISEALMHLLRALSDVGISDPGETRQTQCRTFTRLALYTLLSGSSGTIIGSLYRDLLNKALQTQLNELFGDRGFFSNAFRIDELFANYLSYFLNNIGTIEDRHPQLRTELASILAEYSDISDPLERADQVFLDRLTVETHMPLVFLCREAHWNYFTYIPVLLFIGSQRYADHLHRQQQDLRPSIVRREISDPYFRNIFGSKIYEYLNAQREVDERPFIFVPHRNGPNKLRLVMCVPEAQQTTRSLMYFTIQEDERYKPLLPNGQRNSLAVSKKLVIRQLVLPDEALSFPNERVFDSLESIIRDFVRPINNFLRSIARSSYFVSGKDEEGEPAKEQAKQTLLQSSKPGYRVFIEKLSNHSYTVLFKLLPTGPVRELRLYIVVDGVVIRYRRSYYYTECHEWADFIEWFNKNAALLR
ncbi:Hypothetical protein DHA2_150299 [Giardia duodenalis]|uniref:Uncharacterized protein n=1 Tax=Giardia intestinalis TaxID=5741 RepID=V6TGU7_GIAIN|nr:Hypothetical protein DHA2_150299 [Giardia intestinalis]